MKRLRPHPCQLRATVPRETWEYPRASRLRRGSSLTTLLRRSLIEWEEFTTKSSKVQELLEEERRERKDARRVKKERERRKERARRARKEDVVIMVDGGTSGTRNTDTSVEDGEIHHQRVLRKSITTTISDTTDTNTDPVMMDMARWDMARNMVTDIMEDTEEVAVEVEVEDTDGDGNQRLSIITTDGHLSLKAGDGEDKEEVVVVGTRAPSYRFFKRTKGV
jgi:hypothetical protein